MQKPITQKTLIFTLILVLCFSIAFNPILSDSPITDSVFTIGTQVETSEYVIFKNINTYYVKDGSSGGIKYSGTNATSIFENAFSNNGTFYIKSGEYIFPSPCKLYPSITLIGDGSGQYGGTILKASNTFSGDSLFDTQASFDVLIPNINMYHLRIDANSKTITGLNLTNIAVGYFFDVAIVNADLCVNIDFYGTIPPSGADMCGGVHFYSCRFRSNDLKTCVNLEYNTQDWFTNNWFVSGANISLRIFNSMKIHGSGNEIDTTNYGILLLDDGNPNSYDINFDNTWITPNASVGYPIYIDLTNPSPYRAISFTDTRINTAGLGVVCDTNLLPNFEGSTIANRFFEQALTVSAPNGLTTVTVSHLLISTPKSIVCTPSWDCDSIWVSSKNSTHFVVEWETAPSGDKTLYCYVETWYS